MEAIAGDLPDERDELLAASLKAIQAMHAAVLRSDGAAAEEAADRYDAVIWKMNGGTFFASRDCRNPDAPGHVVERYCAAPPGNVPMWGQVGEFLIVVDGVESIVAVRGDFGQFRASFHFHVVDPTAPFISETGFRSHWDTAAGGRTVDQVAIEAFSRYLKERRRRLERKYRGGLDLERKWPWLAAARVAVMVG
ncbi:TPA: hypothetical protein ACUNF5_007288 [Burkholderia orbicola]